MSNQCEFNGRIATEPESNYTPNGAMVAKFSLADEFSYKKNNQWEKKVSFPRFEAWGKTAERIMQLKKGDLVIMKARHQIDEYEKEGKKVYINKFIVSKIDKLVPIRSGENNESTITSEENYAQGDIPF